MELSANKALHLTALPGGRQVFRWPACLSADMAVGQGQTDAP